MELASFPGFVRTVFIIIFCFYLFKFFIRIAAPILMKKAVHKMQEKMQEQYKKQQAPYQSNTSQNQQSVPKVKKKVGDYIDYEEIK